MRRISLVVLLVVGALGVLPDTAEAQIFRRRRARHDDCCCMPVYTGGCCGGTYGGPGFVGGGYGGPIAAGYSDCGPVYSGQPMPAGYTAGYPNAAGSQPMPSPSLNVMIRDGAFEPSRINIRTGETVRWTNNGAKVHTVTADDGSFDSGNLEPGKSYSRKFNKAGTFNYHCEPHKDVMKASVVVTAGGNGSTPAVPPPPKGDEPLPKNPGEPLPKTIDK